jgi:hypothetical protein
MRFYFPLQAVCIIDHSIRSSMPCCIDQKSPYPNPSGSRFKSPKTPRDHKWQVESELSTPVSPPTRSGAPPSPTNTRPTPNSHRPILSLSLPPNPLLIRRFSPQGFRIRVLPTSTNTIRCTCTCTPARGRSCSLGSLKHRFPGWRV